MSKKILLDSFMNTNYPFMHRCHPSLSKKGLKVFEPTQANQCSHVLMFPYVCVSGGKKCWFFGKFCKRTKWMIPNVVESTEWLVKIRNIWHDIAYYYNIHNQDQPKRNCYRDQSIAQAHIKDKVSTISTTNYKTASTNKMKYVLVNKIYNNFR